eukprot:31194-Pelagococcus_subviridis.AAC.26
MRHTGGFASGENITRSKPASSAISCASAEDITPTGALSSSITRTSGRSMSSFRGGPVSMFTRKPLRPLPRPPPPRRPPPRRPRPRACVIVL